MPKTAETKLAGAIGEPTIFGGIMTGIVKIFLRAGNVQGGNSLDDVIMLAKSGPAWFEMDFRLNKQNCLLSGHDNGTYAQSGHPLIAGITDPDAARNRRGGRCATLAQVLTHMAPGSRLFIDLKDTMRRNMERVITVATTDIQVAGRSDETVIMAYAGAALACKSSQEFTYCFKLKRENHDTERQAIGHIETAVAIGARYYCASVPATYHRLPGACLDAGVTLIVPLPQSGRPQKANDVRRREILKHLENGVRHFICNFDSDWLGDIYGEFLGGSAIAAKSAAAAGEATAP